MPPKNKNKLTREEILENKRKVERLRYERLKNDPQKREEMREKERQKYLKKKEKGLRKLVKDMNPREHRAAKKTWRTHCTTYRAKQKTLKEITNTFVRENTPNSDRECTSSQSSSTASAVSERRKRRAKKIREKIIKNKDKKIADLKKKVEKYKKRLQRLESAKEKSKVVTPNTKLLKMLNTEDTRKEVVKKALFGEVLSEQLQENYAKLTSRKEKQIFSKVVSGNLVEKHKIWRNVGSVISYKQVKRSALQSTLVPPKRIRKSRVPDSCITMVRKFFEDDNNSRLGAGKHEYITRKGLKKQKRYLLDSILNLYKKCKSNNIKISYQTFCRLRPFWVVSPKINERDTCLCIIHANLDLKLSSLHGRQILSYNCHQKLLENICCDRYDEQCLSGQCQRCIYKIPSYKEFDNSKPIQFKKWIAEKQSYQNTKSKTTRFVTKYLKKIFTVSPRQLIEDLHKDLSSYLNHERNIIHQYKAIKYLKENLSDDEVLIHMDFSENYSSKYGQEIQAYHFGGSRTQLSLHTVVVYTKQSTQSYCTVTNNTSHSPAAIWTHLQPVLNSLPPKITSLHFMSDGPVTQYRNKTMFYILASKLQEKFENIRKFSYNFSESGYGKGAPDGVGATCKRTADAVVAAGGDIYNLETFVEAIQRKCPGIIIKIIDSKNIEEMTSSIEKETARLKSFVGTLKVHQITGKISNDTVVSQHGPVKLTMKSLSCFCSDDCAHFKIGTLDFSSTLKLKVDDVYSESDNETSDDITSKLKTNSYASENEPRCKDGFLRESNNEETIDVAGPSSESVKRYNIGDYVLVKYPVNNTEYRYAGVISHVDEGEEDLTVTFLKICDKKAHTFRIDENDISDVNFDQIIDKLPNPDVKLKGNRIFYSFPSPVPVFEK